MMKAIFIFEGDLDESNQFALSEAVDVLAKDWGLSSYLDDVIEDSDGEQCEHGNSRSANCSDCDEQELHDWVLRESLGEVYNMLTECLDDIVHDKFANVQKGNSVSTDITGRVEKAIYNRIAWHEKQEAV